MGRKVYIHNCNRPQVSPTLAVYCDTFFCQLRGLMFAASLAPQAGLLLVQKRNSRLESAIHMLWMRFDLAVIWINSSMQVVDTCLAYRWRLAYFPKSPAMYVLEVPVSRLADFQIGEVVRFEETSLV